MKFLEILKDVLSQINIGIMIKISTAGQEPEEVGGITRVRKD